MRGICKMNSDRPEDRLIVIRHRGRSDYAEVLLNILRLYLEEQDQGAGTEISRQSG